MSHAFEHESQYVRRREWIAEYFDRTASAAWAQLTSDAPVSRIRATVRAGREQMRDTLLGWLPQDLRGTQILDSGCGTGALSITLAERGARVVAIDLSPTLIQYAKERAPTPLMSRIEFDSGDMLDPALGAFDYVVAMDSLIHYRAAEMIAALRALRGRTHRSVLFTIAPRTPLLAAMHAVGRLFPRGDRAPSIEPVGPAALREELDSIVGEDWHVGRNRRVSSGFYTSEAMELVRDHVSISDSDETFI